MRKLLSIVILFVSINGWAQNFEGEIVYKLTYVELPSHMQGMMAMLPAEMNFKVSGTKTKLTQSTSMGGQVFVVDNVTNEGFMLMDMMGQKTAVNINASSEPVAPLNFTATTQTDEIQGYDCTKYIATTPDGVEVYAWVTDEINVNMGSRSPVNGIDGFPVGFSSSTNGMTFVSELVSAEEKEIPDSEFEIPEGYTITETR